MGSETVQVPADVLEKMQAKIDALSDKVGLQEEEVLDPNWPKTLYRLDPDSELTEHDAGAWEAMKVHDQDAMDKASKMGWKPDVPKCWYASFKAPKAKPAKKD